MREALKKIYKKIELNAIGEQTQWKQGYAKGLADAVNMIEDGIDNLIVPNNNYFVIVYDGDKNFPYVEEMRLYKISAKKRKTYFFSRNLYANFFNTKTPDLILASKNGLRKRVFFTREDAEKSISQ